MPSRNRRSNSAPFAAASCAISSGVSMPGISVRAGHVVRVRTGHLLAARLRATRRIILISSFCDTSIRCASFRMSSLARALVEQLDHLDRLRVMADHALHELDVGPGVLRLRQRSAAPAEMHLAVLAGRARLDDRRRGSLVAAPAAIRQPTTVTNTMTHRSAVAFMNDA